MGKVFHLCKHAIKGQCMCVLKASACPRNILLKHYECALQRAQMEALGGEGYDLLGMKKKEKKVLEKRYWKALGYLEN